MADCPADFHLPPAVAAFDAGVFLPRDDPDWFGRSAYPPRILLLSGDALWAVPHPSANEAPCPCGLDRLSFVESGHMLLKGWLAFRGAGFNYTAPYNTRGLPSVLRFMRRFRSKWLGAARLAAPEVVLGDGLDVRFANALADELDPGETVAAGFFQPPRELRGRWPLLRRQWIPGDLVVATRTRLMWITDRDCGSRLQYGSIASYAPLRALQGLDLIARANHCYLQVDLNGGLSWHIPIAAERRSDAEKFATRVEDWKVNSIPRTG